MLVDDMREAGVVMKLGVEVTHIARMAGVPGSGAERPTAAMEKKCGGAAKSFGARGGSGATNGGAKGAFSSHD